jgi:hypothetical protein
MHPEAEQWVRDVSKEIVNPTVVMDQGGRNVNGSIRKYFPTVKEWIAVDITDGEGVDIVADCATYIHSGCDVVISTELFEHTPKVEQIIQCAYGSLVSGGHYIVTTAGLGRPPHNAHGGEQLLKDEYYRNIDPNWLIEQLWLTGFKKVFIDIQDNPSDVRAWCIK